MQMFAHESFTYKTPHIFALGQKSLRHLQWGLGKTHQAIVINGESGAGKVWHAYFASLMAHVHMICIHADEISALLALLSCCYGDEQ